MANEKDRKKGAFRVKTAVSVLDPEARKLFKRLVESLPHDHWLRGIGVERGMSIFADLLENIAERLPWPLNEFVEKGTDYIDFLGSALQGGEGAKEVAVAVDSWMKDFIKRKEEEIKGCLGHSPTVRDRGMGWVLDDAVAELQAHLDLLEMIKKMTSPPPAPMPEPMNLVEKLTDVYDFLKTSGDNLALSSLVARANNRSIPWSKKEKIDMVCRLVEAGLPIPEHLRYLNIPEGRCAGGKS
jgi:hypothetical protein